MQLEESEEDLKGQHDQPVQHTQETLLQHLCSVNEFGGDPRLYEAIRHLMQGGDAASEEDFQKAFEPKLREHLIRFCFASSSDSDGEGSSGPPVMKSELNLWEDPSGRLFYKGYPEGDFIRQLNIVLHIWNKVQFYPVNFVQMQGFTDETETSVSHLNSMTYLVFQLFETLEQADAHELLQTLVKDFLLNVGARGILTMLGFRKTAGSQEIAWLSTHELKASFNKPHTVLTEEQKQSRKNHASKLTVGARALTKHCHRSSEGFWGQFRGTEDKKNKDANLKLDEVLRDCVWINVHIIVHSEIIVECRIEQGYGMRWSGNGNFRGFLEPQMADGHQTGWKH